MVIHCEGKCYLQEQAAEGNDPESVPEPGSNGARPTMDHTEARPDGEGQDFSRADAMRNLESHINEELVARKSGHR